MNNGFLQYCISVINKLLPNVLTYDSSVSNKESPQGLIFLGTNLMGSCPFKGISLRINFQQFLFETGNVSDKWTFTIQRFNVLKQGSPLKF